MAGVIDYGLSSLSSAARGRREIALAHAQAVLDEMERWRCVWCARMLAHPPYFYCSAICKGAAEDYEARRRPRSRREAKAAPSLLGP